MGFRKNAYATIFGVDPVSDTNTRCRISISRKDKETGNYVDEFSGFVSFFGTANAKRAASLKEKDRIRLGDVDVRSKYDRENKTSRYYFNAYSFETQDEINNDSPKSNDSGDSGKKTVDDSVIDDSRLPF